MRQRLAYDAAMTVPDLTPTRPLGATDVLVSPLCLGGNVFGWGADSDESMTVLDAYASAGGNFVDTADVYSEWIPANTGGDSERIIGDWMHARGNRASVIIATKVAKLSTHRGLSGENIRSAVDQSLRNLRTDYIDLYYAHEDDPSVTMVETLGAFDELVRSGKVRHIAVSNFTADRMREALATSAENGFASYIAVQNHYNLMERAAYETDTESVVLENGMSSLPYFSLARGFLTGKHRPGETVDSVRSEGATSYIGERGDRVLTALQHVASTHATTMPAVALAWLLAQPGVTAPLSSARSTAQLADLLPMASLDLSIEEIALLSDASAGPASALGQRTP